MIDIYQFRVGYYQPITVISELNKRLREIKRLKEVNKVGQRSFTRVSVVLK